MPVTGRCNCGSITVEVPSLPDGSILCYCANCQRASAGLCSVNYLFSPSEITLQVPQNTLKSYQDSDTKTGNTITRQFCGNCGCPVSTLLAGDKPKSILKAGLFAGKAKEPVMEVFTEEKPAWVKVEKAGDQAKLSKAS